MWHHLPIFGKSQRTRACSDLIDDNSINDTTRHGKKVQSLGKRLSRGEKMVSKAGAAETTLF